MNTLTAEVIGGLISNILEKIAFIFVEPSGEEADLSSLLHSKISYFGPDESADIFISASPDLLVELAGNMLGVEPDEIDAGVEGVQALNEFANIVCGEVIHALGGEQDLFSQGIPEQVQAIAEVPEGWTCTLSAMESDEGEPLQIRVSRSAA